MTKVKPDAKNYKLMLRTVQRKRFYWERWRLAGGQALDWIE
jgi:hypothetical protein